MKFYNLGETGRPGCIYQVRLGKPSLRLLGEAANLLGNIVLVQICKFQKDLDEQAGCEFEVVISMNTRIINYIVVSFVRSTTDIVAMQIPTSK